MNQHKYVEPTKDEKDHIFSLVKSVGKRSKGILIKDVVSLHEWAGVPNGFDARFLAKLYECNLTLPGYSDQKLAAKLEGWVSWYKQRLNGQPLPTLPATATAPSVAVMQTEKPKLHFHERNWNHKCEACGGYGTKQSSDRICDYCGGSGWMSYSQYKNYTNDAEALRRQRLSNTSTNTPYPLPANDDWKKSQVICPVCDGDGGAAGQCYKCAGSGWIFAK